MQRRQFPSSFPFFYNFLLLRVCFSFLNFRIYVQLCTIYICSWIVRLKSLLTKHTRKWALFNPPHCAHLAVVNVLEGIARHLYTFQYKSRQNIAFLELCQPGGIKSVERGGNKCLHRKITAVKIINFNHKQDYRECVVMRYRLSPFPFLLLCCNCYH